MWTFALQWSLHGVYATARAQKYCVSPSQYKHGPWTEADVLSSTAFCGRILSAPRKKMEKVEPKRKTDRDLYDVEVIEVDTTRKQLKIHFVGFSHGYDEWRDYDNERNYFPFVRLEKMFFRAEGLLVAWPSGQKLHFFRWRKLGCRFKSWRGYFQFLFLFLSSYFYPSAFYCLFSLLTVSFARLLRKHISSFVKA